MRYGLIIIPLFHNTGGIGLINSGQLTANLAQVSKVQIRQLSCETPSVIESFKNYFGAFSGWNCRNYVRCWIHYSLHCYVSGINGGLPLCITIGVWFLSVDVFVQLCFLNTFICKLFWNKPLIFFSYCHFWCGSRWLLFLKSCSRWRFVLSKARVDYPCRLTYLYIS